MKLDAYETYALFMALRSHFTRESYDYFKYGGKTKVSVQSFEKNRNKYQFQKLSKKYSADEMEDFFIANFIKGKSWIVDLLDDDATDIYLAYVKRKQSFTYCFKGEVSTIFSSVDDPRHLFQSSNGEYPEIINAYLRSDLSLEVLTVLNTFINFSDKFDERLGKDDIIWSKISFLIRKIKPFLQYDKSKIKNILKECI
jgi:hypothetical protein